MPGHVKLGAGGGEDPDPAPYLFLTFQVNTDLSLVNTRSILSPDWLQLTYPGDGLHVGAALAEVPGEAVELLTDHRGLHLATYNPWSQHILE